MIRFDSITKQFAGVTALDEVSLSIERGEVHGLMGENGAGKSTFGKILAGIHQADAGRILIDGAPMDFRSPRHAMAAGVGMVHQELAFCPDLSIAENLCLGQYPRRAVLLVDWPAMHRRAAGLLAQIGVTMDLHVKMRDLSTAQEQLVQIAAAVGTGARVLIFDEPTSSLAEREAQQLFSLIEQLRSRGVTMIYVSHRMPEVFALCDRISVLRDGKFVGTLTRAEASEDKVVQMMIGRSVEQFFPKHLSGTISSTVLSIRGLSSPGKFRDISFDVRRGEVLGLAGLVGAGRSEVATAIFGLDPAVRGNIELDGQPLPLGRVRESMRRGIGLVPEDRKRQGLVLSLSCRQNFSLAMLRRLSRLGIVRQAEERAQAETLFRQLAVKTPSIETPVASLSGGNQQKVVIAKWLARGAKLLIVDEPTRGVDIGAKAAIHALLDDLARSGVGVLLISSELPEVISLSTRILVMRDGRLAGEIDRNDATQDRVLRLMAGVAAA